MVKGWDYAYTAVLIEGWDFRYYVIDATPKLEEIIIEKTKHFWYENVLKDIPPEPQNLQDVVDMYRDNHLSESLKGHQGIISKISELKEIKTMKKTFTKQEEKLQTEIALFMREYEYLKDNDDKIVCTYKYTKEGNRFDAVTFKKDNPELYEQYLKATPSQRRFLLKDEK